LILKAAPDGPESLLDSQSDNLNYDDVSRDETRTFFHPEYKGSNTNLGWAKHPCPRARSSVTSSRQIHVHGGNVCAGLSA
jgi:hypothetical protein